MSESTAPLLEVEGISKRFGATLALSNVSFDVRAGEVHALMGENGAGKSTLMKIISGNYQPDTGSIRISGSPVTMASPRDAMAAGVAIIHQELNTIPEMTVAENLATGNEPLRFGMLDRRTMVAQAREKLARVGADIDPNRPIGQLSVGMQQMVEIARAVAENAKVLVLDEPTAALSRTESQQLFELIRSMRSRGMGLVYISHRMEEVWELADRVTVFRDGQLIGTRDMRADGPEQVGPGDIVKMMVGRDIDDLYVRNAHQSGDVRLAVRDLTGPGDIGPVSFDVRGGQVVGMVGLIGAGRTEVARLIYGADRRTGGAVTLDGEPLDVHSPIDGIKAGVGLLPESRKDQALFLDLSVKDNIGMSTLRDHSSAGVVRSGSLLTAVRGVMDQLKVRSNALKLESRALSGGNQQKLVLGRLLLQKPKLLILDEPTRGVDIGAKSEIYRLINEIAGTGAAVLVISSDLPEALGISDELLVMRNGRIVATLDARHADEERVMQHATGVYDDGATTTETAGTAR
ncbi:MULTISPECIES: sugar ABC transporter ATP-binding protein [unclassified Modestobacter]|uniref:sugar ABC transporter ATP-binding protein n=1 Tax=unclassified Modestobacter TaxID=2643866 RepID=UPI0022AA69C7|nr:MULTISPECIES: sugar ABC transporter ATP-binding protein [unclassified Modestobacter]MCZ2824459.1 sugar ABC transporter ATP-binding protein [Modestobacter sp. VKM Ac-2981]MCZ2854013.1 sugar ABC transporter ATP-binding protein [Modestobacter sp. VKM Ac-2982]